MPRSNHAVRLSLVVLALIGMIALVGCPPPPAEPVPDDGAIEGGPAETPEETPAETPEEAPAETPAETPEETPAEPAEAAAPLSESELLLELPGDVCNTPDAMCLLPDGNLILSVPNFNDLTQPAVLMKITPDNRAEKFYDLPKHPGTGENLGPLGICVAPSGDLFLADYQMQGERQSRVMRIKMEEGKPVDCVPVITGFTVSNAVVVRDGHLYVSETQIDPKAKPAVSGVLRFKLEELEGDAVELATPITDDPHLLATIETFNEELPLGADGLCFDADGNLYIGNFSDGTVHKFEFDAEGKVSSNTIFAKADCMKSADGLFMDSSTGKIYVADSKANAVQVIAPDGSVQTLAQNGETDGLDGGMDQPCEVILRGREVIVSNMDWPVPGCVNQKYDKPCTLAVIKLED